MHIRNAGEILSRPFPRIWHTRTFWSRRSLFAKHTTRKSRIRHHRTSLVPTVWLTSSFSRYYHRRCPGTTSVPAVDVPHRASGVCTSTAWDAGSPCPNDSCGRWRRCLATTTNATPAAAASPPPTVSNITTVSSPVPLWQPRYLTPGLCTTTTCPHPQEISRSQRPSVGTSWIVRTDRPWTRSPWPPPGPHATFSPSSPTALHSAHSRATHRSTSDAVTSSPQAAEPTSAEQDEAYGFRFASTAEPRTTKRSWTRRNATSGSETARTEAEIHAGG